MDIIAQLEEKEIARLTKDKKVPAFAPGDTLCVNVRVVEGKRTRTQAFEGVCIARSNRGVNSNFTVRKISYGEGVERVFPLYSPNIETIDVVRRGDVRRAKLYYLRGRTGRAARIAERRMMAARENEGARESAEATPEATKAPPPEVTETTAKAPPAKTTEKAAAKPAKKKSPKKPAAKAKKS